MAVEGLIGRPGSGKTYELTRRALRAADQDRLVFSNYPINHPNAYLFEPADLFELPRGLVVIDEAHLWFPARMALKLPMSWLTGISQTRKKGWDLLWSAQHETRVDRVVRDITNWMHLASAWFTHNNHPVFFTYKTWEPELFRRRGHNMGGGINLFSTRVAQAYNTHGAVMHASHTQAKDDPYATGRRNKSVLEG